MSLLLIRHGIIIPTSLLEGLLIQYTRTSLANSVAGGALSFPGTNIFIRLAPFGSHRDIIMNPILTRVESTTKQT